MNFTEEEKIVSLGKEEYTDMLSGESVSKEIQMSKYGIKILKQ
jgi:beta-galactosidase